MSTGLDSMLAALIVKHQGVDVEGICFTFQFDNLARKAEQGEVEKIGKRIGILIHTMDISEDFLPILLNPPHGYGSAFNPCIDCHLFMLKTAHTLLQQKEADFIVTGEVVGQRPMSQRHQIIRHMNNIMDFKSLVLRPLSAKLLELTTPEKEGWVNRDALYDISGRNRQRQIQLADEFGLDTYSTPAGGCILTDRTFAIRARALIEGMGKKRITVELLRLLRFGRHFWLRPGLLVVVGRDKADCESMEDFAAGRWSLEPADVSGPLVLAQGIENHDDLLKAAAVTARYTSKGGGEEIVVNYRHGKTQGMLRAAPAPEHELKKWQTH